MARLESDLAENTSPGPSPKKSEKEKKLSKKEKKKKRLAKDSAENEDEVQSSNKSDPNDGQGYFFISLDLMAIKLLNRCFHMYNICSHFYLFFKLRAKSG